MTKMVQSVTKSKGKSKTKMRIYNLREAQQVVKRNGWTLSRTKGDHFYYKKEGHSRTLILSMGLNRIVWSRVVNDFNLNLNA